MTVPETWVISDTHFNHKNIVKYQPDRPEYFEDLIFRNLQRVVQPQDRILHVGDFTFGNAKERDRILDRWLDFPCAERILSKGNHDRHGDDYYELAFDKIYEEFLVIENTLISHFPRNSSSYQSKDPRYEDVISKITKAYKEFNCVQQIHGHTHGYDIPDPTYINASVESTYFMPLPLTQIIYAGRHG